MKNTIATFVLLLGLIFGSGIYAQMAEAQQSIWDISEEAKVNTTQYAVWNYLNDAKMLKQLSNGYVKSVSIIEDNTPPSIKVLFTKGNNRSGKIVQSDVVNKFMVIKINKESLPKGVKEGEIAIFTKSEGKNKSSINWKAKIVGNKQGKQILFNQLKAEFEAYKIGFSKRSEVAKN